jgi:hypothetical protein
MQVWLCGGRIDDYHDEPLSIESHADLHAQVMRQNVRVKSLRIIFTKSPFLSCRFTVFLL